MENQQATKNWFIGILEGEGCFINTRCAGNEKWRHLEVRISNTEIDIINACRQFLWQNGVETYILKGKPKARHKPIYELYISGKEKCESLYRLIKADMECRINELEKILGASTTTRETSSNLEWMIGILEAEGCFTINTQNHKAGNISHNPAIIMENTNFLIVTKVVKTLHKLGLAWYIRDRQPTNPKWKSSRIVTITGCRRVSRFLSRTNGLWIGSKTKRKVSLLSEYCYSRLSKNPKEIYSEREHEIARLVKMKI